MNDTKTLMQIIQVIDQGGPVADTLDEIRRITYNRWMKQYRARQIEEAK